MKTGIFSGRFDPSHVGHILTILGLLKKYSNILVVVLDYPDRKCCTAEKAKDIFDQVFYGLRENVTTIINTIHFAEISLNQYRQLCWRNLVDPDKAIYLSGNSIVIAHMKEIGVPYEFVERTDDHLFSGTKIRMEIEEKKIVLDEFYGIDG